MKTTTKILILSTLFLSLFALALSLGSSHLNWNQVFETNSPSFRVLFELRLPRILLTLIVGGALAMLGGTYQILFHNPLAEPYILGVSNAVILGVALSEIVFGIPSYSYWGSSIGFLAAMAVTLLMLFVYLSKMGEAMHRLILFGLGMQFVLSSILFLSLSYYSQHMGGGTLRWLFGQIPWLPMSKVGIFGSLALPFFLFLFAFSRHLDALNLGDHVCRTLGYSPVSTRVLLLLTTSAFVALVVSFTGAIGFVGLVVPHMVRLVFHPSSTRKLFILSFVLGACFLMVSDMVSRILLPPFEFPIGILTTLIGGPIFLYLLWKR